MVLFQPLCLFSEPLTSCSNGWLLIYFLSFLSMILLKNFLIQPLIVIIFTISFYVFSFGMPIGELLLHWILGTLTGAFLLYNVKTTEKWLRWNAWDQLNMIWIVLAALSLFGLLFYNVDYKLPENDAPFGLGETFFMCMLYLTVAPFIFYRLDPVEKPNKSSQFAFICLWISINVTTIFAFCLAFLPLNSLLKTIFLHLILWPSFYFLPTTKVDE
jgi:hypothetical protein